MNVTAFIVLAGIIAGYVMLDGYDLGIGTIHLFYARSEEERAASFRAIGPFWSGNEVMLIVAGAVLFALFPRAYAVSFSGFYLPFMIVLWLLMARGMSIELRGHFQSDLWYGFWDVAFSLASALLAIVLGVALGNVLRGLPLDHSGYFTGTFTLLLNGYAVLVGVFTLIALAMHGAAFAAWRIDDFVLCAKARRAFNALWILTITFFVIVTWLTALVHPIIRSPALWIAPVIAVAALGGSRWATAAALRFALTSAFLFFLIACAAQTLFPYLLPAFPIGAGGLTISNSAAGTTSITTAVVATVIGIGAALIYATLAARRILKATCQR